MKKLQLSVEDSSLAFFASFIICQIAVLFFVIFGLIFSTLLNINANTFLEFVQHNAWGFLITAIISNLCFVLVYFIFSNKKETNILQKPKTKKILLYILLAIASYFVLSPIINSFDILLKKLGYQQSGFPYELNTANYFISIISLVILPAICEELLFRGLIFKGLKTHGKLFSIFSSAIMFSIFHMSLSQTLYPFLFGLLLAVIMYYENNIIYCITLHVTNNFLSLTLSYFKINLFLNHWLYYLIAILLLIAFIGIILFVIIKKLKNVEKIKLNKSNSIYFYGFLAIMIIFWLIFQFSI